MMPPAAWAGPNGDSRASGTRFGGQGSLGRFEKRGLSVLVVKSAQGTLAKSRASASQDFRSSTERNRIFSIDDAGSGAGRNRSSVLPSRSGNRPNCRPSESRATTRPENPSREILTMHGLRCPASERQVSMAALAGLPVNNGIQPGQQSRVSR